MSQSSTTSLSCSKCSHAQEFTTWNSINVALNPEKKGELRNGSLHRFTCAQCGNQSEVNYPTLYHDPGNKFMVWLNGDANDEAMRGLIAGDFLQDYRLRLVNSRNHLIEKTHVLESGLDDRLLELFKVAMSTNNKTVPAGDMLFAGIGIGQKKVQELQFAVVSESGTQFIGATLEAFKNYSDVFIKVANAEPFEACKWARVDRAYATGLMRRHLPPT